MNKVSFKTSMSPQGLTKGLQERKSHQKNGFLSSQTENRNAAKGDDLRALNFPETWGDLANSAKSQGNPRTGVLLGRPTKEWMEMNRADGLEQDFQTDANYSRTTPTKGSSKTRKPHFREPHHKTTICMLFFT